MFFSAGFICLTLLRKHFFFLIFLKFVIKVNAPLSPLIIKKLEIVKPSLSQIKLYDQILIQMDELVNEKIKKKLKKSKFLNNVNWNNVKSNIFNKEYFKKKTAIKLY